MVNLTEPGLVKRQETASGYIDDAVSFSFELFASVAVFATFINALNSTSGSLAQFIYGTA